MLKVERTSVMNLENAMRGARNPLNSWARSDSYYDEDGNYVLGPNDLSLAKRLRLAGSDHRKYVRQIFVCCDVTAPLYWWKEYDTYKVGTVKNSCSKMHKIHVKPFNYNDFTHEGIDEVTKENSRVKSVFYSCIDTLEWLRVKFNETQEKKYWRALIEMLPESYNMRATVLTNYQVLKTMYHARKNHKLDEWHNFCRWCETLPYFKEVCIDD